MYEKSLFLVIKLKFSIMFNGVNLQRGSVFILVFVIDIAIKIIVHYRDSKNLTITQPYEVCYSSLPSLFTKAVKIFIE